MSKNPENRLKLMKKAYIDREILNDLKNFNEIFRQDATYDNIKSHIKPGLLHLFRRYIFRKTTEESN